MKLTLLFFGGAIDEHYPLKANKIYAQFYFTFTIKILALLIQSRNWKYQLTIIFVGLKRKMVIKAYIEGEMV